MLDQRSPKSTPSVPGSPFGRATAAKGSVRWIGPARLRSILVAGVLPFFLAGCPEPNETAELRRATPPPNVIILDDEVIAFEVRGSEDKALPATQIGRALLWPDVDINDNLILFEHRGGSLLDEIELRRDGPTLLADLTGGREYLMIRPLTPRLQRNHKFLCGLRRLDGLVGPGVIDPICRFILCPADAVSAEQIQQRFPVLTKFASDPNGPFRGEIPNDIGGWGTPFGPGNVCDKCTGFGRPGLIIPSRDCYDEPLPIQVEIQVNNTATGADDYLTWGPTRARIRLSGSSNSMAVHLTNDDPATFPDGGDVVFAPYQNPWPANTTATQDTLAVTLPASGGWVDFIVAGKYPKASTADKDAVIMARANTVTGDVLASRAVMVRVRKNANSMQEGERDRFLQAMRNLRNRTSGGYLMFQEMHRLASTADDEGHGQPAFYPWHRALLLHVERELQEIDPSVTLPYWDWDAAAPNVFDEDFMGAANSGPGFIGEPVFSTTNPLLGWNTDLPFSGGELRRNLEDHRRAPLPFEFIDLDNPSPAIDSLAELDNFGPRASGDTFSRRGERESHNPAHGWPCGGGHVISPNRSSADPLFYLLHSQVDRQWAYWQWKKNRFGTGSGGTLSFAAPQDYDNTGNWNDPGVTDWQRGSFLEDGMWPWDGTSGGSGRGERPVHQATSGGINIPNSRPVVPSTPFAASTIENLWPLADAVARPRDMIDYLGRFNPADALGFCYDDVPYN